MLKLSGRFSRAKDVGNEYESPFAKVRRYSAGSCQSLGGREKLLFASQQDRAGDASSTPRKVRHLQLVSRSGGSSGLAVPEALGRSI